jgi:hypothetical protein
MVPPASTPASGPEAGRRDRYTISESLISVPSAQAQIRAAQTAGRRRYVEVRI